VQGEILYETRSWRTHYRGQLAIHASQKIDSAILDDGQAVAGIDFMLGDYSPGFFAWEVVDMCMLTSYIPAKGKLGIWEYNEKKAVKGYLSSTAF
jgi:hypothetical protein